MAKTPHLFNHRPTPVRTGSFTHDGHQLAYEVYGYQGVPCILTNGILLDSHINRDLAQGLVTEGYQVILLDLLGHGRSDKPSDPGELRVDLYAQQVVAALDHLNIDRAMVGGLSLGAITTLHVAALAPERVLGLFIEMPVMEWSTPVAALLLTPLMLTVRNLPFLYRPFARLIRRLPRPAPGWMTSGLNALSQEPETIAAILHGVLVGPVVPTLQQRRNMTMPALVIGHGGDGLHALDDAIALSEQLPNARLLRARSIIELRHRPRRLWPEIQTFMAEVRALATPPGQANAIAS